MLSLAVAQQVLSAFTFVDVCVGAYTFVDVAATVNVKVLLPIHRLASPESQPVVTNHAHIGVRGKANENETKKPYTRKKTKKGIDTTKPRGV